MARDYKKEAQYEDTPEQIKNRGARNKARREAEKKVGKAALAGKDVDHIKPLSKGGAATDKNTRIVSVHDNRSFPRTSTGKLKSNLNASPRMAVIQGGLA